MVDFYVSSTHIRNFRGVKDLTLDLDPDAPAILIGPNNSGKSTVLDAVGLCLGSPKFNKYLITDDDFRHEAGQDAEEFFIDVHFRAKANCALPAVKGGVGDPIGVHGVRVVGSKEEAMVQRYLLNEADEPILLVKGTPVSKAKQEQYKGMGLTGRRYARTLDIHQWLPEVWQLDSKNLFLSLYEWKTGPLQRLLRIYKDKLFTEEWKTPSGKPMPAALDQLYNFLKNQALPTPFWKDTLSGRMAAKFKEYLGSRTDLRMAPGLNSLDSWILSELQIKVAPAENLEAVDCRRLGDGWQSLIRLAALELAIEFSESERKVMLLIEEPETYLHPHLRRRLRTIFRRLQTMGHQSVVTTHSPELISFSESQQILRLNMFAAGIRVKAYVTATAGQALKDQEKLYERGNHEMVFANYAILTEGKADQYTARLGLEKLGQDCDVDSISVVDCGGVNNLPDYARLCSQLGIPWVAIHDADIQPDGTRKIKTEQARAALEALKTSADRIFEWDNDLEGVIGYEVAVLGGKVMPQWISTTLGSQSWEALRADKRLVKFCSVISDIQNHLLATNSQP